MTTPRLRSSSGIFRSDVATEIGPLSSIIEVQKLGSIPSSKSEVKCWLGTRYGWSCHWTWFHFLWLQDCQSC